MRERGGVFALTAAALAWLAAAACVQAAPIDPPAFQPGFPRLMGMNIGAKNYDQPDYQAALARYQVVVLGFYPGWRQGGRSLDPIGDAVRAIKARNPSVLIAQYSNLTETPRDGSDLAAKVDSENWWLRDSRGRLVQWTNAFAAYEINTTEWAKPDQAGLRYAEWRVERDYKYFHVRPEFDIWYLDNGATKPLVREADWDGSGRNARNDDPRIAAAYRRGNARGWEHIRKVQPGALLIGNADDLSSPEYWGKLNGAFMEAVMGKSWSMESWAGWDKVMERYRLTMRDVVAPKLVGFNVVGRADDYRLMRYGLASCLMDDGYFAYSTLENQFGTAPWFDEFDADLGQPIDPAQVAPWRDEVYRRRFERGMVLLNPTKAAVSVDVPPGYRRLLGKQEPTLNTGLAVSRLTIGAKDGVILKLDRAVSKASELDAR